jgi:hypothetical protein
MARPSSKFPTGMEPNRSWLGPTPDIGDLQVHFSNTPEGDRSVSCWELGPGEYQEVVRTGKIYLHIYGMHPPVYVGSALDFDLEEPDKPSYLAGHVRSGAQAEIERLRQALAFARAAIKSGEGWTEECERILRLEASDDTPLGPADPPGPVSRRVG